MDRTNWPLIRQDSPKTKRRMSWAQTCVSRPGWNKHVRRSKTFCRR
jgi:hypothetical protein